MTAVQLNTMNTELWQSIEALADSESLMKRLTRYAKKLVKERESDPTLMSKEEYFKMLDQAEQDILEGKGRTFTNADEMNAWLNSLKSCED